MHRAVSRTRPVAAAVDAADRTVGDAVEAAVRAHHRRRLRRAGWPPAAGEGEWARGGTPPRSGNRLAIHVDGRNAFPVIAAAIDGAQRSVEIAGWHLSPDLPMRESGPTRTVREVLAAAAERVPVRVLLWAGPPAPLFHPWRSEVRRSRDELMRGTAVRCALDSRNRPMHCHHEKIVIVDGRVAFVGGIDLSRLEGNRFDGAPHSREPGLGWHDAAAEIEGPAVIDVARHLVMRWQAVTGEALPSPSPVEPAGGSTVQIVRTVPEGTYPAVPRGDFTLLDATASALRGARRLVYIENQFLWSSEIVQILAGRLRDGGDDMRVVVLLPAHPKTGADDTRGQLDLLSQADPGGRFLACTLKSPTGGEVYVHAKVTIVDDRWMSVGSGNLNAHSLFNDTEMDVVTDDTALIRATRERLWAEHLGDDRATGMDARLAIDGILRPAAQSGSGALTTLAGGSRRVSRLLGPLQSLLVDG